MYFVKRKADVVKKETFNSLLAFGDVSHLPLDQLNSMVESVSPHSLNHLITTCTHSLPSLPLPSIAGVPHSCKP